MHVFQCLVMCRIVYLGIFTQCQYIPFTHANRRRILQRPIKIQWDTRSVYIFIQHFFFQFCAGLILAYEGEFNDGDFILRINVYVHLAKSADPGQAPQLRYNVGPGYSLFAFLLSWYILRSDAICVGRQTMVFTECKLKFSPLFYQFIKQNRLRPGTARCNTWIVSNQTVQTLIK